jgi:carbamoyl-phosphate synthase large subunit
VTAVLFTCAGQRVDIVTAFARAGATTIATDADPLAPALYHAHRQALVPRMDDPRYIPALRELVQEHGVKLVVPVTDIDMVVLVRARDQLKAPLLLPNADVVQRVADKYLAHLLFEERGIPSPPTWLPTDVPDDVRFPVLVKARHGFGSRHIYRAESDIELEFFLRYTPVDSIVQTLCMGEEFSIDVFGDWDSVCLNAIPRTMIQSKGGESIKGRTIKDWSLIDLGRRVAETVGVAGPATIQCFRESDGMHYVTDVNTRFGGAFPLPTAAGSGYAELAVALARGERPEPRLGEFREGVVMTRYFSDVTLADPGDGTLAPIEELTEPTGP